jgi:membrane fusion protein (multidrug efflux system)
MIKKIALTVLGIVILFAIIGGIKALQIKALIAQGKAMVPPAEAVTTVVAGESLWAPVLTTVGNVTAVQGVTVAAQLSGNVTSIAFTAGSTVAQGDLLVQMDISSETAQLHSAEAALTLAHLSLDRTHELFKNHTVSQAQVDLDNAAYQQAEALVESVKATIEKKTIRAPFAGRLGVRLVNVGQTLNAGEQIVSLQSLSPVYVDCYVPQQEVARLSAGLPVQISGDAIKADHIEGKITAISPEVDSATRNIRVEATFTNEDETLRPGMFVDVKILFPARKPVVSIPTSAVLYAPYGNSVYIVETTDKGTTVRQQLVRLGVTQGDYVEVITGVNKGEEVVSTGAFKLRPGAQVIINNTLSPKFEMAPKPTDS